MDSMCKSVEVVHKLHTVVHVLPEVECLDMLPKTEPILRQHGCCALTNVNSSRLLPHNSADSA